MNHSSQEKRTLVRGGVVLIPEWRDRLFAAVQKKWEESNENPKAKLTVDEQANISTLSKHTWERIMKGEEGVHKSTLEAVFAAVELNWDKSKESVYYTLPPSKVIQTNGHFSDAPIREVQPGRCSLPPLPPPHSIERPDEVAEIKKRLKNSRLVTLTGVGGIGKTWLAKRVANELVTVYPDGVCWVELAEIKEASLIVQAIAAALNVRENAFQELVETLKNDLADKADTLLILDNCEHLYALCAQLARQLLETSPKLRLLITSRRPLNLTGWEDVWPVPLLATPDLTHHSIESKDLNFLKQIPSVRLFIERASTAREGFRLSKENALLVAEISCKLEGIPLAIELAAARARVLSIEAINHKLEDRLGLLTGGDVSEFPHHETMGAAVDWSYDLLSAKEKRFLQRLSVFAGGWTLEAAEQVCRGKGIEPSEALDLLTSLLDWSLVAYEEKEGRGRYRLLETVRQYAREKLITGGEIEAARKQHQDYYLNMAEEAEFRLIGPEQSIWLQRLDAEYDNLRAALEWSLQETESETGQRLCGAMTAFWWIRGYFSEGREWCSRALNYAGGQGRTKARAKVLNGVGNLALFQSDYALAETCFEKSLDISTEIEEWSWVAYVWSNLGQVAYYRGDYVHAGACNDKSLNIFQAIGDKRGIANAWSNLGEIASHQGDYVSAEKLNSESLEMFQEIGDKRSIAFSLSNLGNVAYNLGDYASAWTYYDDSLEIRRENGDRRGIAYSLTGLGNVASHQGHYDRARDYYAESLNIRTEFGDRWGIACSLEAFAELAAKESKLEQAVALWRAAEALRKEIGAPLPPNERESYDRAKAELCQRLSEEAIATAWVKIPMTLNQAVALALEAPE